MGEEVVCVSFAKTFIHQIIKTPCMKITYTRTEMGFLFTLRQAIALWILIIKSIIALSAVESWWKNETSKRMAHLRQVRERNKSRLVVHELNHDERYIE